MGIIFFLSLVSTSTWTDNYDTGLQIYLKMNESAGTDQFYDSHKGINITLTDDHLAGIIGNGYGTTAGTTTGNTTIGHSGEMTISTWVWQNGSTSDYYLCSYHDGTEAGSVCWVMDANEKMTMYAHDGTGLKSVSNIDIPLSPQLWTMTVNDTTLARYINGTFNQSVALDGSFPAYSVPIYIGSSSQGANKGTGANYDEFAIWNRTLNDSEILGLWNNSAGLTYVGEPLVAPLFTENYQNYSISAGVSTLQNYTLNITYNSHFYNVSAKFFFNGTMYSATATKDTNQTIFKYNGLSIKKAMVGNQQFYWTMNFTNSSETGNLKNTTFSNQTINPMIFGLCNATLTNPYVNFTFQDESDNSALSAKLDTSTFYYWITTASLNQTYTYSQTANQTNYTFCFSPIDSIINLDASLQYSNTGFPQRRWDNTGIYSNLTNQTTLYLLPTASGIYVTYQIISAADQPITDVYVTAEREISGVWTEMGNGFTGSDGGITFWLNPDYVHRITTSKTGYDTQVLSHTPTQSQYTIVLGQVITTTTEDFGRGVYFSTRPSEWFLINNTHYIFNLSLTSNYWTLTEFGFVLTNSSGTNLGSNSSTTGTGGIVSLNITSGNHSRITMNYYYLTGGNYTNFTRTWTVGEQDYGFSIKTFFDDLKVYIDAGIFGLNDFSVTLLVFIFIFITVGLISLTTGFQSPLAILIEITVLVTLFDFVLGMVSRPFGDAIPIATILSWIALTGYGIKEALIK